MRQIKSLLPFMLIAALYQVWGQTHFPLNSSTVALWNFSSKVNGTFPDMSPNGYSLSNANNFGLAASPNDSAVVFTGSANYLSRTSTTALTIAGTGKMTFEARIFMTQYSSLATIAGTYEGLRLSLLPDGSIGTGNQKVNGTVNYWTGQQSSPGIVPLNRWVDIAASWDNSTGQAYAFVDGIPVQLFVQPQYTLTTDPWRTSTSAFCVGGVTTNTLPFNGKIDEVRVSNNLVFGAGLPSIAVTPPRDTSLRPTHFSLNSSTVALWTFNAHSSGNFLDRSPNGYSLSNANNFALTPSPFDSAVVFTGSSIYLSRPSTPALTIAGTGKMTFEVRLYMTQYPSTSNTGGVSTLIGNYEGIRLYINSNGVVGAGVQKISGGVSYWGGGGGNSSNGAVPLNRWVDLAAEFDNSTGQAYVFIDGSPVQLYEPPPYVINTDPWRTSTSAFCVGGITTDNEPFNGKIDEVRVSNNLVFGAGLPSIAGNPPTIPTAPYNLAYSQNPAVYGVGVAITPNVPTLAGTALINYSVTPALPAGLTLNATTGVISGTPSSVSAAAYYVVTASNSYGITSTSVGINVQTTPPPSNLSYSTNPASYLLGTPITPNTATIRGTPPFTFSASPALPPGLTLNTSTGTISGTPTAARAFSNYVVTASNTAGSTTITLVVATGFVVVGLNQQPDSRRFTLLVSGSSSMVFLLPGNARDGRLEILDTKGLKIWESRTELENAESSLIWNGKTNGHSISGGLYFARMIFMDKERNRISTTVQRIVYSP